MNHADVTDKRVTLLEFRMELQEKATSELTTTVSAVDKALGNVVQQLSQIKWIAIGGIAALFLAGSPWASKIIGLIL